MRLFLALSALIITTSPALAEWTYLPGKDALSTPATTHSSADAPDLVVVCNNMVRLTYVRWGTEFGIDKKHLPSHITLDYSLSGDAPASFQDTVWTIARPEKLATQYITHDLKIAERLTANQTISITTPVKDRLPALTASFNLAGLQAAMNAHNLPCSEAEKFPLKSVKEQEAEAAAAEARAIEQAKQQANKKEKPTKTFYPMPDASMFDP
jgi:hypothetical protein